MIRKLTMVMAVVLTLLGTATVPAHGGYSFGRVDCQGAPLSREFVGNYLATNGKTLRALLQVGVAVATNWDTLSGSGSTGMNYAGLWGAVGPLYATVGTSPIAWVNAVLNLGCVGFTPADPSSAPPEPPPLLRTPWGSLG